MESNFLNTLLRVMSCLNICTENSLIKNNLFCITKHKIETPIGDIFPLIQQSRNSLPDIFVEFELIKKLANTLKNSDSVVRLNHIGICYQVSSQKIEKQRLVELAKDTNYSLYEEKSNDDGVWLFLGNTTNWEDPMIEFIPIEKTNDQWSDYWLPHIQIDLDTRLNSYEINDLIKSTFGFSYKPFPISINDITYIIRNRLGSVDGINIDLDLATNSRDVQYLRKTLLTNISS